jgi:hypothetical protein
MTSETKKKYRVAQQITFPSGDVFPDQEIELTPKDAEKLVASSALVPVEAEEKAKSK